MSDAVWKIDAKIMIEKSQFPGLLGIFEVEEDDEDDENSDLESALSSGFEQHGINVEFDQDGNIVELEFDTDISWDELQLLEDIAPFVKDGSYVELGSFQDIEPTTKKIHAVRWLFQEGEASTITYLVTLDELDNEVSREIVEIKDEEDFED